MRGRRIGEQGRPAEYANEASRTVGEAIRGIRADNGIRQRDLAKRAGVSVGTVTRIERGETGNIELVGYILEALGYELAVVRKGAA